MACHAQGAPSPGTPNAVRYQFGDDSDGGKGWASPAFDDSSWPAEQQDQWPRPAFYSNGFVWVRFCVPVRSDTAEPLALRVTSLQHELASYEIFVNGTQIGSFGKVPPRPRLESLPRETIFDLSSGLARPGEIAQVTLRLWYPPFARRSGGLDTAAFIFDQSRILHAEEQVVHERALERDLPLILLNVLILLVGYSVLLVGYSSRSRDVLLCGSMLATLPLLPLFLQLVESGIIALSALAYFPLQDVAQIPSMVASVVFIWKINGFREVFFKRLMLAAMVIFNLSSLIAFMPSQPSLAVIVASVIGAVALRTFDVVNVGANLWAVFTVPRNRLIAIAMMLVPGASLLNGVRVVFQGQGTNIFDLTFSFFGLCLASVLGQRAWVEWRARDTLQAEFETAREMQQRLVPTAVDVPGFRIESVYAPAKHVGGDFFYVRPLENGGLVLVVGDVSGKGLKAAMTVNLVIGALRTMPPLPPARILAALNRGLVGQMLCGFVTCCAARIEPDGQVTIANAGHLPPYRGGAEVPLGAGLPLGIHTGAEYDEEQFVLNPSLPLTFLSDGIVEARNRSGELFGFERTLALSTAGSRAIADAAIAFGQEDDITVLTLTRLAGPGA